ncbi:MAG: hypothetical protein ACKN9U_08630, partial [Pirellulaceae bacterium]
LAKTSSLFVSNVGQVLKEGIRRRSTYRSMASKRPVPDKNSTQAAISGCVGFKKTLPIRKTRGQ